MKLLLMRVMHWLTRLVLWTAWDWLRGTMGTEEPEEPHHRNE